MLKVAAIQLTSGPVIDDNLMQAAALIKSAAQQGGQFICTPEVTDQIISDRAGKIDQHFTQETHPGVAFFSALAKDLGVTLSIGSMCVRVEGNKLANRSFLFGADGVLKTTYDKIHLYNVDLPSGESHRESATFSPGEKAVLNDVDGIPLGLTICYDMRFPHLYRDLAKAGAQIITVPSAFTVPTGRAHWEILLRARAIETGCFIIAAAQVGDHHGVRVTYGHSLIISPWGEVIAISDRESPHIIIADLEMSLVATVRGAIPSILHDRDYLVCS